MTVQPVLERMHSFLYADPMQFCQTSVSRSCPVLQGRSDKLGDLQRILPSLAESLFHGLSLCHSILRIPTYRKKVGFTSKRDCNWRGRKVLPLL